MTKHFCDRCGTETPLSAGTRNAIGELMLKGDSPLQPCDEPIEITLTFYRPRTDDDPTLCHNCVADLLDDAASRLRDGAPVVGRAS